MFWKGDRAEFISVSLHFFPHPRDAKIDLKLSVKGFWSGSTTRTWTDVTNFPVLDKVLQRQQEQEYLKGQIFRFKELQRLGSC